MKDSILRFKKNVHSQNGEDGILEEVFNRLKITRGKSFEFGAPTKKYCSNTYRLVNWGWYGQFLDCNPRESGIIQGTVTAGNVNELVPNDLDLLSIDIDGGDYEVWQAYTGLAKVVVIEIRSSIDPIVDYYASEHGSNFSIMNKLASTKGYFLLCHTGNCIYIRNEYLDQFPDADSTFNRGWLP